MFEGGCTVPYSQFYAFSVVDGLYMLTRMYLSTSIYNVFSVVDDHVHDNVLDRSLSEI